MPNFERQLYAALYQFACLARRDFGLATLIQDSHESLPINSAPILVLGY
jgi:hypothetical protein